MLYLRGCPHAHICAFLHPDDKLKQNADRIDQMIWAEIPLDYGSDEFKEYVKEYRREDDHRSHIWKDTLGTEEMTSEDQKDQIEKKSHKVTYFIHQNFVSLRIITRTKGQSRRKFYRMKTSYVQNQKKKKCWQSLMMMNQIMNRTIQILYYWNQKKILVVIR